MTIDIDEMIKKLGDRFIAEKAGGVVSVIQFKIAGEQQGDWYLQIKDQQCDVVEGRYPNPALTIMADAQDVKRMLNGEMSLMKSFMSGAVQVQGDLSQAIKLMELFKRG